MQPPKLGPSVRNRLRKEYFEKFDTHCEATHMQLSLCWSQVLFRRNVKSSKHLRGAWADQIYDETVELIYKTYPQ